MEFRASPLPYPLGHKSPVAPPGAAHLAGKLAQHLGSRLPGLGAPAEERPMATPWIPIEGGQIAHHLSPKGVEMDVARRAGPPAGGGGPPPGSG